MHKTFSQFVRALRNAGVGVSPAETLDGLEVLQSIGWRQRARTKAALSFAMAKSEDEKERFDDCFDRYFSVQRFTPKRREAVDNLDGLPTLTRALVRADEDALAFAVAEAARNVHVDEIRLLRQKSRYARQIGQQLGLEATDQWLSQARSEGDTRTNAVARARQYLGEAINEFVEQQYRLHVDATGRRAVVEAALKARLAEIPADYHQALHELVVDIAQKLLRRHKRQRKRARRGQLDLRKTLRHNMAHDGNLFDIRWRQTKRKPPSIYVVCDTSGSMALVTRFFLLFLHELQSELPAMRSFVFSNELAEVSDLFTRGTPEKAIEEALLYWGSGVTDYGRAFCGLRDLCHAALDRRSVVIVLGDARSNYLEPRSDVLAELANRAGQLLWLNPEERSQWTDGDSEMPSYVPHCTRVFRCQSLPDLERFGDQLLTLV